ncbi:MAG: tetratricopeptide repeat protein [Proteobacteria bacterium]|nr:tetratricopeptide repeat protein [Pseudomonadota bacterium]
MSPEDLAPETSSSDPETVSLLEQLWSRDKSRSIFVRLAELYLTSDRADDAVRICWDGLAVHPDYITGRHLLARAQWAQGDVAGAEKTLLKAVEYLVQEAGVLKSLARLLQQEGRPDRARPAAEAYLALNPDNDEARDLVAGLADAPQRGESRISTPAPTATLAELYHQQGHLERAAEVYRKLLAAEPDNEQYRGRLAELEGRPTGRPTETSPDLEALANLPPELKGQVIGVLEDWLAKLQT